MKRRDLLIGALSGAGLLALKPSMAAKPCPPRLSGTPEFDSCGNSSATGSLSADASSLNPGEWKYSIDLPADLQRWDISWQNRTAFWDDLHEEIQVMGKSQASAGGYASHYIYSAASNTWRTVTRDLYADMGRVGGNGELMYGHIWICTFDNLDDSGDYYFLEQDSYEKDSMNRRFRRFDRSVEAGRGMVQNPWKLSSVAPFDVWNTGGTPNPGMLYHPNLLGSGRPGVFLLGTTKMSIWDKSNDEFLSIGNAEGEYKNRRNTASLYVPGLDIGVFGNGKEGVPNSAIIIPAGYDITNVQPELVPLPFEVSGGNANNSAHMLLDPRNEKVVMLLERGGSRVWTNADIRHNSWKLESFSHPFWNNFKLDGYAGRWTPCSIGAHGVVLGIESYSGDLRSLMWRPG